TRQVKCKLNLIPLNPFPESGLGRSSNARIRQFSSLLVDQGVITTVRKTRGEDIDAACGQLAGDANDRTRISERMQAFKPIPTTEISSRPLKRISPLIPPVKSQPPCNRWARRSRH